MSNANGRKGYKAEHDVEVLLRNLGRTDAYRPRAGARNDVGDIRNVPMVISVKDRTQLSLGVWCDQLTVMVARALLDTGVVWHKRAGRADPRNWYVTTTYGLFDPLLEHYCDVATGPIHLLSIPRGQRTYLGAWVDQMVIETAEAGAEIGYVIHPRPRDPEQRSFVTTTGRLFLPLFERWCER